MLTANHKQVLYVKIIKSKDLLRRVNLKKASRCMKTWNGGIYMIVTVRNLEEQFLI